MLDVIGLKTAFLQSGVSVKGIAAEIGVDPVTVYRKMAGKTEFTASELLALKKILHLDVQSFCNIFFADELTQNASAEA